MADSRLVPLWLGVTGALLAATLLISGLAAQRDAPMLWFVVVVMAGAGVAQCALAAALGQLRVTRRVLAYSVGAGAILVGPMGLGYLAVGHVGAGFLSLTYAFPILLTWLMARLVGIERADPRRRLAVMLGVAGGVVLGAGKISGMPVGATGWAIAACLVPVVIAAGNIYRTKFWPAGAQPVLLAGLMMLGGAAVALPVAALTEDATPLWADPGLRRLIWWDIAAFTVQYVTYFQLQRAGGPLMLSLIGSVAATLGAAVATLTMGERMPAGFWPASILTATGVGLMLRAWHADRHAG